MYTASQRVRPALSVDIEIIGFDLSLHFYQKYGKMIS